MTAGQDADTTTYWSKLAQRLLQDLEYELKLPRRISLLHALARIYGEQLDNWDQAQKQLNTAIEQSPAYPDTLWDGWRNARRWGPTNQLAVLNKLAQTLKQPTDHKDCQLRRFELAYQLPEHADEINEWIEQVDPALEDHRGVLWALVAHHLDQHDPFAAAYPLERLARLSSDTTWRAALLIEVTRLKRLGEANDEEVISVMKDVLAEPCADWEVTNEILHLSEALDDWSIHEQALEKIARAALDPDPATHPLMPLGHTFRGYDRGQSVAASTWWLISRIRLARLNQPAEALKAIVQAHELAPNSGFLATERARLLRINGQSAEALDVLAKYDHPFFKAELALHAGRPDLVPALLAEAPDDERSIMHDVLQELSHAVDEPAPREDAQLDDMVTWFLTNPGDAQSAEVARRIAQTQSDLLVAQLATAESTTAPWTWSTLRTSEEDSTWWSAVDAVLGQDHLPPPSRSDAYREWGDRLSNSKLKAAVYALAARLNEQHPDRVDDALDLYEKVTELHTSYLPAQNAIFRLLRAHGRTQDLAGRLAENADVKSGLNSVPATLYERAFVLEQEVKDSIGAAEIYMDLSMRDPLDVTAVWAAVRLAFRSADFALMLRRLEHLIDLCPKDAPRLHLIFGEVLFHVTNRPQQALSHFEKAAKTEDAIIAQTARLYRLFILRQIDDLDVLDHSLQEEALSAPAELVNMFMPALLDVGWAARGANAIAEIINPHEELTLSKLFWLLMVGVNSPDPLAVPKSLCDLANALPTGGIANSCHTAAALLLNEQPAVKFNPDEPDLGSPDILWHVADRLENDDDPLLRLSLYAEQAEQVKGTDDDQWVDWMLYLSEAQEDNGATEAAHQTVLAALEKAPEHPGLLDAQGRLAQALGLHQEAAQSFEKLARFFISGKEKANLLAAAALIQFERLDNAQEAESLGREALFHSPESIEAHDVLVRVLRARGDEPGLIALTEHRLSAQQDTQQAVVALQNKTDELLLTKDYQEALEPIDQLLSLTPKNLVVHQTKIDILLKLEQWENAIAAMLDYIAVVTEPTEIRSTTWQAAELIADKLVNPDEALSLLGELIASGDRHPENERRAVALARRLGKWEEAVDSLSRLAALVDDPLERSKAQSEEAKIRLEKLYDVDGAAAMIDDILAYAPGDVTALRLSKQFRDPEETEHALDIAVNSIRHELRENPADEDLIIDLKEIARLKKDDELAGICQSAIDTLTNVLPEEIWGQPFPKPQPDHLLIANCVAHRDERCAAADLVRMTSSIAGDEMTGGDFLAPPQGATLFDRDPADPIRRWVHTLARLLDSPDEMPRVHVSSELNPPLQAQDRFFVARTLYRHIQGLGRFPEGDTIGPIRWVLAVTAVVLGDKVDLPMPTDRNVVISAHKAISRKTRRRLMPFCEKLVEEGRDTLRAWGKAISYSADRFGLLAAMQLPQLMPLIIEDSAGPAGVDRFNSDATGAIANNPRCLALLSFFLSEEYQQAVHAIGFTITREED